VTIGYVGRLHREKGLDLFVAAVALLARRPELPIFHVVLCGPSDVARGGSGNDYAASLVAALAKIIPPERLLVPAPVFDDQALAPIYREIDIFCYPSLATRGETFGVAVAEAMAAGAVPVVSRLACFSDFVRPGSNGETFDHTSPDAAEGLAATLGVLLNHPSQRAQFARTAQADMRTYNFTEFASRLLEDFSTLK
jgi:glycosyltransferase involved in cell wall biosynthesis